MPAIGSLVNEKARRSAAFVSVLLSSLLSALLAPTPIPASPAPHAPATTSGFVRAANLATPTGIATASREADEDGSEAGDPPAIAAASPEFPSAPGPGANPHPLEPGLRIALPAGHGFIARAPPLT